ncbi:hypothetical protein NE237_021069 [Protea cynaroides]|uniref:Uncharacterized protein n=1 Tax=Protea cynaroides TaxID=273540 RepID=A0A9Q0K295_9MAGN|nr:hypothetical protein NE237_021069 [Protea cynaroides]
MPEHGSSSRKDKPSKKRTISEEEISEYLAKKAQKKVWEKGKKNQLQLELQTATAFTSFVTGHSLERCPSGFLLLSDPSFVRFCLNVFCIIQEETSELFQQISRVYDEDFELLTKQLKKHLVGEPKRWELKELQQLSLEAEQFNEAPCGQRPHKPSSSMKQHGNLEHTLCGSLEASKSFGGYTTSYESCTNKGREEIIKVKAALTSLEAVSLSLSGLLVVRGFPPVPGIGGAACRTWNRAALNVEVLVVSVER